MEFFISLNNSKVSKIMKLLTYIFSFAYLLTTSTLYSAETSESKISAVVNEKGILLRDVEHRVNLAARMNNIKMTPQVRKELKGRVRQVMIDEELQRQLGKKYSMEADKMEIESAWESMEGRLGLEKGHLKEYLASQKIPQRIVKEQIEANILWREYLQQRYLNNLQASDEDVRLEKAKIQSEKDQDQALLSEIVLNIKTPEEEEEARNKANQS